MLHSTSLFFGFADDKRHIGCLPVSIPAEDIACVHLVLHIVQAGIVAVGDDRAAHPLELCNVFAFYFHFSIKFIYRALMFCIIHGILIFTFSFPKSLSDVSRLGNASNTSTMHSGDR